MRGGNAQAILYGEHSRSAAPTVPRVSWASRERLFSELIEDPRWEGFGYLRARDHLTKRIRQRADKAVIRAADRLALNDDAFFEWVNSKEGRWFAESFGDTLLTEATKTATDSMRQLLVL